MRPGSDGRYVLRGWDAEGYPTTTICTDDRDEGIAALNTIAARLGGVVLSLRDEVTRKQVRTSRRGFIEAH